MDETTSRPTRPDDATIPRAALTPMMRQYRELKRRYPDYLLLFRLGDFYEMFFDDAHRGARLLQIALTSRQKGDGGVPMAGIPHHAAHAAAPPRATGSPHEPAMPPDQKLLFKEASPPYTSAGFGTVVGQLHETFVVAASDEEVFFIDQHVAHERVLFERLKAELGSGPLPSQKLLLPEALELGPASHALLAEWLPTLSTLGFSLEEFGRGTFLLRAVPSLLKGQEPRRLIEGLLEEVGPARHSDAPPPERALAFVAGRAAVKANQPLDRSEMARLLQDLSAAETPYFCPHGRPVVSRLSLREIKRELRRTW
ncbi:MAG: hypothetical protein HY613_05900 [Candidatus Rokubacteria bacterium]|nr:hypothetical protein [Candidatus Rokubacteria bacterium]